MLRAVRDFLSVHRLSTWLTVAASIATILTFVFTYFGPFGGSDEPKRESPPDGSKDGHTVFSSTAFRLHAVAFHHVVKSGAASGRFLFKSTSDTPLRIAIKSIDPRDFATNRAYVQLIAADAQKCWVTNKDITGFAIATKDSIIDDKTTPALRKNEERRFSVAFRCSAGKSLPGPVIHMTFLVLDPAKGGLREIAATVRAPK